jgi:hypothetical protein
MGEGLPRDSQFQFLLNVIMQPRQELRQRPPVHSDFSSNGGVGIKFLAITTARAGGIPFVGLASRTMPRNKRWVRSEKVKPYPVRRAAGCHNDLLYLRGRESQLRQRGAEQGSPLGIVRLLEDKDVSGPTTHRRVKRPEAVRTHNYRYG